MRVEELDLLAHGLWTWVGGEALRRRSRVTGKTIAAGVALAVAPDLLQMVPVLAGVLVGDASWTQFYHYAVAHPGQKPVLEAWIVAVAHHLHCAMHSLVVVTVVSLLAWWRRRVLLYPLLGWWLHIATDIPTHSADYYAVPVLYPFTYRGFDGFAWTSGTFLVLNYLALAVAAGALYLSRRGSDRTRPRRPGPSTHGRSGDR